MLRINRAPPSSAAARSSPIETVLNNDDLLTQILVWLPALSILNFKSISKRWLSLVTSPNFVHKRHSKAISGLCFLLVQKPERFYGPSSSSSSSPKSSYGFLNLTTSSSRGPFTTLDFADDDIRILSSCNGLILCSTGNASTDNKTFYIYNPTTNKSTTIPDLNPKPPMIVSASLAFDPSKSLHYKVICVIYIGPVTHSDEHYHYKLVIYSSETRDWKPYGDSFSARELDFRNGVFWGSSVHWASMCGETSVRFDVEQERLLDLPMPPLLITEPELVPVHEHMFLREKFRHRFFGQSGDHLHLGETHESKPLQLEVFELEPDYSGWVLKYTVDLSPMVETFPEMVREPDGLGNYTFTLLGLVRDEEDDEPYLVLMLPCSHMAVRYRLKDGKLSKICDLNPAEECCVPYGIHRAPNIFVNYVYPFTISLASV